MAVAALGFAIAAAFYVPSRLPRAFPQLRLVERLPWLVALVLRTPALAGLALTGAALLVAASLARRGKPTLLALSTTASLALVVIAALALRAASATCLVPPSAGLSRCACDAQRLALECHCDRAGEIREQIVEGSTLVGGEIGERLFYGDTIVSEPERARVRVTDLRDPQGSRIGARLELVRGSAAVECRYPSPCNEDCGVCAPPVEPAPRVYALGEALECVDVVRGTRPVLDLDTLVLGRTVWAASPSQRLPANLDVAAAIPTSRPALVGNLQTHALDQAALRSIVEGAGRAPRMRKGGVRECRTSVRRAGVLARQLDRELAGSDSIVLRLTIDD